MRFFPVTLFAALFAALRVAALAQQPVPEIPFDSAPNFFKLPPDLHFGEVSGVAVNSKGHVFVFSRGNTTGPAYGASAAQLLEFGSDGKYIREIGKNLYAWSYSHAVRTDKDDNIWAIDKGSDMIVRFTPEGRVSMVFGRKKEASDEAAPWTRVTPPRAAIDGQFRQPTDVTWDTQGNIFISDGYINSRVAKYDKNGRWVRQWGDRGTKPGEFNTPHSIAADAKGNVYVGDRSNSRIQVFDNDLTFKAIYDQVGAPWAMCITPGPHQYLYSSNSNPDSNNSLIAAVTGEIYVTDLVAAGTVNTMPEATLRAMADHGVARSNARPVARNTTYNVASAQSVPSTRELISGGMPQIISTPRITVHRKFV